MSERSVDYVKTAESYGFRIQTKAEFDADPDVYEELRVRVRHYSGTHVLWETESDADCFMLVGNGRERLAKLWFEADFANYDQDHQKITYAA